MKQKALQSAAKDSRLAPAYPFTGPQVFQRLRAALTEALGFQPSFLQLSRIIGENVNSVYYWFKVLPQRHVLAFLALLERLPEPKRRELINLCCRELPTIDHPRLAHDPLAVAALERILHQSKGLTWIEGGTDYHRTFVLTALGHSFPRVCGHRATVSGLDVHEPRKWVPIEKIIYLREPMSIEDTRRVLFDKWPSVCASKAPLLLLNGVWSVTPALHDQIIRLCANRHVVVTAAKLPDFCSISGATPLKVRVVTIGAGRESDQLIRFALKIQEWRRETSPSLPY